MARNTFDSIKVKDQLGSPDSLSILGPFKKQDDIVLEGGPLYVISYSLADVAKWDDPDTKWDGSDEDDKWVDWSRTDVETIERVENYDNTFLWRFAYDDARGDDNRAGVLNALDESVTTATQDTTNKQIDFTSGQLLQTKSMFKDESESKVITDATITVTEDSGTYSYSISADGGSTWKITSNNTTVTFPSAGQTYDNPLYLYDAMLYDQAAANAGSDLRLKITEGAGSTGTISLIKCRYTI